MTRNFLLVLAAGCICSLPMRARGQDLPPAIRASLFIPTANVTIPRDVVRIPMRGTDRQGNYKCPYFQVYVNGHGPFTFLYDTGGGYTTVSSRVVKAAGAPVVFDRHGHRDVVHISTLAIGGVKLHDLSVIDDDSFGVDGVLGTNSFGNANLMFDLARREMWVSAHRIDLPASFEVPYGFEFNVPTVPVTIGNHTVSLLIDTGDDAYGVEIRKTELGDAALEHAPATASSVMNGANLQRTAVTTLRDTLRLGPVELPHAFIAVNDDVPVGDFGYAMLKRFRFVFDPQSKTIRFQPQFSGRTLVLQAEPSAGFRMAFDGSARIVDVRDGSSAAAAGLSNGDRLIALNGVAARMLSPRRWDELIDRNRALSVRWSHDGSEHSASISRFPIH